MLEPKTTLWSEAKPGDLTMYDFNKRESGESSNVVITRRSIGLGTKLKIRGRRVFGYALSWNTIDRHATIFKPGAFSSFIKEQGQRVPYLWVHNREEPIGYTTLLEEDDHGLFFEASIAETEEGDKRLKSISEGVSPGNSVGFYVNRAVEVKDEELKSKLPARMRYKTIWQIEDVELVEISTTAMPSNPGGRTLGIRSTGPGQEEFISFELGDSSSSFKENEEVLKRAIASVLGNEAKYRFNKMLVKG